MQNYALALLAMSMYLVCSLKLISKRMRNH